jgi:excisionase family DNA binding protein
MTYRQAEEVYALSRTTLRALVADGTIKARNVGRAVRLNRASLDAYMNGDDLAAAR